MTVERTQNSDETRANETYRAKAKFYDVDYDDQADHDFLAGLIASPDTKILEIPCGSGRNLPIWLSAGNSVTAVDREPAMVTALQNKLDAMGGESNVTARVGDMTDLRLGETFDLIVVPREAFQLIPRDQSVLALTCLRDHLSAEGRIMIDTYMFARSVIEPDCPDYYDPMQADGDLVLDWNKEMDAGTHLSRARVQQHHGASTLSIAFQYTETRQDTADKHTHMSVDFANYTQAEFANAARDADLTVTRSGSDYAWAPITRETGRRVYLLEAAPPVNAPKELPPTGRLKVTNQQFDNAVHAQVLSSFDGMDLDDEKLSYFQSYQSSYFSGPFIKGMGAEDVLDLVHRYCNGGRVLDVGAGPTCGFWLLPARNVQSVTANDVVPEALAVLETFLRKGTDTPQCYADVLEMFDLPPDHWATLRNTIQSYAVFDSFAPWPATIQQEKFDLITAFGVYSIAPNVDAYQRALEYAAPSLAPSGHFIGAEWLRKDSGQPSEDGGELNYLNADVIAAGLSGAGFAVCEVQEHAIQGDDIYDRIITWASKHK